MATACLKWALRLRVSAAHGSEYSFLLSVLLNAVICFWINKHRITLIFLSKAVGSSLRQRRGVSGGVNRLTILSSHWQGHLQVPWSVRFVWSGDLTVAKIKI